LNFLIKFKSSFTIRSIIFSYLSNFLTMSVMAYHSILIKLSLIAITPLSSTKAHHIKTLILISEKKIPIKCLHLKIFKKKKCHKKSYLANLHINFRTNSIFPQTILKLISLKFSWFSILEKKIEKKMFMLFFTP
jgi:hypothetical protein